MVAMTRAHIAEPELVAKLARGEEARVRPCVGADPLHEPAAPDLHPQSLHRPRGGVAARDRAERR